MLGIALRRRTIARGDIAAVELREVPRYRNVLGAGTRFDLVVRVTGRPRREVVVAEDLESEVAAEQTRALIARHAGLPMN
jgi:hypothetical protein